MSTRWLMSSLVSAAFLLLSGCKQQQVQVAKIPVTPATPPDIQLAVNGQGYATMNVVPGQKIIWTVEHPTDRIVVEILHTIACDEQTLSSTRSTVSEDAWHTPRSTVTCTIRAGFIGELRYQIVLDPGGAAGLRVVDCSGCPIGSHVPPPGGGGAPSPPSQPQTAGIQAAMKQNHPSTLRSSSSSGIAFNCEDGKTLKFDYHNVDKISVGDLPTIRTWVEDGMSTPWTVDFKNRISPCDSKTGLSSTGNFRCRISSQAPAKFDYQLKVPGCGSLNGVIWITAQDPHVQ